MNAKTENAGVNPLDTVKLVLAVAILLAGIVGYYWFIDLPAWQRWLGVIAAIAAAFGVFMTSAQGQATWKFVQTARVELRKVVWPTRQETVQTTLVIIFFVIVMGVFFWLLDMFLLWATRMLTGQGG
ncbi:MAG: preprotein translocase subunit SecE [Gammaproteobacteria bacterium]